MRQGLSWICAGLLLLGFPHGLSAEDKPPPKTKTPVPGTTPQAKVRSVAQVSIDTKKEVIGDFFEKLRE